MSDEKASEPVNAHDHKPTLREVLKASNADASAVMEHMHSVTGRPRQIVVAGLLGVCIVFLASMLSLLRVDTPLQVALIAFVVAIVLLSLDFTYVSVMFGPGLNRLQKLFTTGLQVAAWLVFEGLGVLAVLVGVAAVVLHLSVLAFWVGIATFVGGLFASLVFALLYAMLSAWREYKSQQGQQEQQEKKAGDASPAEPASALVGAPSPSSAPDAE